jgi:hypothetical protein
MTISNEQILKGNGQQVSIQKDLDFTMPHNDAESFLVDTIQNASTLPKLQPLYKKMAAGTIPALQVSRRKLRLASANDNPNNTTRGVSDRPIDYAVKKVKWDEWLQNDDVWAAINGRGDDLESKVIEMIQKQFAADLQDLAFNGDTNAKLSDGTTPDPFLSILDGFVKKMKASTYKTDLATNDMELMDFVNHVQVLPEKFKSRDDITWYIGQGTHDRLVARIVGRQTGYGDAVLTAGKVERIAGYPVEVVADLQQGFAALTPAGNLKPVFTRDLRYIRTGQGSTAAAKDATYHVLFAYLDCLVLETEAVAWMTGDKL